MSATSTGWDSDIECGPACLFVRLRAETDDGWPETSLAEHVWALLEQQFNYCLVLELDEVQRLDDDLVEQIAELADRIERHDGLLRLCGLSAEGAPAAHAIQAQRPLAGLHQPRGRALFARCDPGRPR